MVVASICQPIYCLHREYQPIHFFEFYVQATHNAKFQEAWIDYKEFKREHLQVFKVIESA